MKTGMSDNLPSLISYSDNKLQIDYDAEQIEIEDMNEIKTVYKYKYIELENYNTSYGELVSALIHNVYSPDAEVALINNELAETGTQEYQDYQTLRTHAKEIAKQVLIELGVAP